MPQPPSRADRVAELILSRAKTRGGPGHRQVVGVVVEADAEVTERRERLEQHRPFHERRVAKAADHFQAERLLPLADADVAEHRQTGLLDPDVGEGRPAEEGEVHLKERVDRLRNVGRGRDSRATNVGAILNAAVVRQTVRVLIEEADIGLKDRANFDRRISRRCWSCNHRRLGNLGRWNRRRRRLHDRGLHDRRLIDAGRILGRSIHRRRFARSRGRHLRIVGNLPVACRGSDQQSCR